jgi:diadenosine tetraphosphate (Ap4A) HIT family hydrolase
MNETILKFGYPDSLICAYQHWVVLLRPQQATLGALVLACTEEVQSFGELSPAAFAELQVAVSELEASLKKSFDYDKLNYLMLMMVDPHVHFHVLPRYQASQQFMSVEFSDPGWPGPPQLGHSADTNESVCEALKQLIKRNW